MTRVKLTNVQTFPSAEPTKEQALKVLEEAAEVVEAFKRGEDANEEIADTIQASCNLASALGVTDLTPYLAQCEERNRRRGRYDR